MTNPLGVIWISSKETQPLAYYRFNGGVISFGGVIIGGVIYFVELLKSYVFIGGVVIGGISL